MNLNTSVFDVWVFRRSTVGIEYLLLRTSQEKADRFFNGGRFWQVPSGVFNREESVPEAVDRKLAGYGLHARAIWAGEHAYVIYNRRFDEMQIISVFVVEIAPDVSAVILDPVEHSEYEWLGYDDAHARVHYRGLKDGLHSVQEYVAGIPHPAAELRLR
jgi:ADP-ribose pyrophosphatase YjhB (NUDIX family)